MTDIATIERKIETERRELDIARDNQSQLTDQVSRIRQKISTTQNEQRGEVTVLEREQTSIRSKSQEKLRAYTKAKEKFEQARKEWEKAEADFRAEENAAHLKTDGLAQKIQQIVAKYETSLQKLELEIKKLESEIARWRQNQTVAEGSLRQLERDLEQARQHERADKSSQGTSGRRY